MSEPTPGTVAPEPGNPPVERHASWLELFFDLVVVAAVAMVAHRLHEPSWSELGISLLLFGAIWYSWTSFTLYANVQGDAARAGTLIAAMAGIGVMAAAVPEADGDHAVAFVVAFIALRILAIRSWQHTGAILVSWPTFNAGGAMIPWIVSIWVDGTGRYVLWAVGLALDVVLPLLTRRNLTEEQLAEGMLARFEDAMRKRRSRRGSARTDSRRAEKGRARSEPHIAHLETEHLTERMGLFVIIVLGESVAQLIHAAAETEWDRDLVMVSLAGLLLVSGLWWLTFQYGFTASPHSSSAEIPAQIALPAHLVMTASLMIVAAGLGSFAAHPEGPAPSTTGALLCGGVAGYFAMTTLAGVLEGAPMIWTALWGVPTVVVAAVLAVFVETLTVPVVVWLLVLVVVWHTVYAAVRGRLSGGNPAEAAG